MLSLDCVQTEQHNGMACRIGVRAVVLVERFIGCVFVYSGTMHILFPVEFLNSLLAYRIVNAGTGAWMSFSLPWAMCILGVGAVTGLIDYCGRILVFGLLIVFCFAQCLAWWRGLEIDCGCWGPGSEPLGILSIATAFLFASGQAGVLMFSNKN